MAVSLLKSAKTNAFWLHVTVMQEFQQKNFICFQLSKFQETKGLPIEYNNELTKNITELLLTHIQKRRV